ncbi:hypothetical protein CsSME_00024776 [Camellia sinensis var. sinensis]
MDSFFQSILALPTNPSRHSSLLLSLETPSGATDPAISLSWFLEMEQKNQCLLSWFSEIGKDGLDESIHSSGGFLGNRSHILAGDIWIIFIKAPHIFRSILLHHGNCSIEILALRHSSAAVTPRRVALRTNTRWNRRRWCFDSELAKQSEEQSDRGL